MGGVVADQLQRARVFAIDEFDFAHRLDRLGEIGQLAVERHGHSALGERGRNALGDVEAGNAGCETGAARRREKSREIISLSFAHSPRRAGVSIHGSQGLLRFGAPRNAFAARAKEEVIDARGRAGQSGAGKFGVPVECEQFESQIRCPSGGDGRAGRGFRQLVPASRKQAQPRPSRLCGEPVRPSRAAGRRRAKPRTGRAEPAGRPAARAALDEKLRTGAGFLGRLQPSAHALPGRLRRRGRRPRRGRASRTATTPPISSSPNRRGCCARRAA